MSALAEKNWVIFFYLGFKVNVGRRHFGDLEDTDGKRDSAQHKQTVVDQDPGQDRMSDASITRDMTVKRTVGKYWWSIVTQGKNDLLVLFLAYLGDSERIRAPCTNKAQVKFTTRKNILRHRKNKRRGTLRRERSTQSKMKGEGRLRF